MALNDRILEKRWKYDSMTEVLLDCHVALLIAMTEWYMGNGGVVKRGDGVGKGVES